MEKIKKWDFLFVIILLGANVTQDNLFSFLYKHFHLDAGTNSITELSPTMLFILGIIVFPLAETLINQFFPFLILKLFKLPNKLFIGLYIIGTAIIFAALHSFSIWYQLAMLIPGLLLAYCFFHFYKKYGKYIPAIAYTALLHSLSNLVPFIHSLLK